MTLPGISAVMVARSHTVGDPQWSPSGLRLGWLDSFDSRTDLVVAPADGTQPPAVVSADAAVSPAGSYGGGAWCWASDDEIVVVAADGRLLVLRADGGGILRVLSDHGSASAPAVAPDGTRVAFARETADACDIAVVPLDGSAWPRRVSIGADYAWDPAWRADSQALAWHEWDLPAMSWDSSRIVEHGLGHGSSPVVVAGGDGIAVGQPRYAPVGDALAFVSDESGWWNVHVAAGGRVPRPVRREANDHAEPAWGPGQRSFVWSPDGTRIAWCRNEAGFGRLVAASVGGRAAPAELAKGWHHGLSWGPQGILATRSGARTPQQIVVLGDADGARRPIARGPVGGFEAAGLAEPEAVEWRSGRTTVHGLLWSPSAPPAFGGDRPPLYVHIHGGPTDQATVTWMARAAYWTSRGYAFFTPNYRGSSGYGRTYRDALRGRWGDVDVADVASGIRALASRGHCDLDRVAVVGGSAGGFTALLLAARHAATVTCAVSLFGVTDLFDLAATTHRFESRYLDGLVGELPRDAARYAANSPISLAATIRVPVLLLQGRDDPVVPIAQADAMADAMRAAGAPVEYHVYDGEGHGFRKIPNVIDEYTRIERFLAKWLTRGASGAA